ncbi:MAG: D-glycero-beta-D-manno-heptose 1-phosphate adenylyltransferase [Chitinophagales bacterium]|nr:D-glycero-beta-D-manno-heptose 1-phosphate adenylyltransferase [Chitinophagales bacterium]
MKQLTSIQLKFQDREELSRSIEKWKIKDEKIIFTNGCFDILHVGHISLLAAAKDLGGKLVIGLNSDSSVHTLKGEGRPINDLESRATMLASLKTVDAVISFSEETPIDLIEWIKPDFLVKGGDYLKENIVGAEFVSKYGGRVVIVPLVEGFSTSELNAKTNNTNSVNQSI